MSCHTTILAIESKNSIVRNKKESSWHGQETQRWLLIPIVFDKIPTYAELKSGTKNAAKITEVSKLLELTDLDLPGLVGLLAAAGLMALFTAFFDSFWIGVLSLLLVLAQTKTKFKPGLLLVAVLA